MSFAELVRHLDLGKWHEVVALHVVGGKLICIPKLQCDLFITDTFMQTIIGDFIRLGLCKICDQDPLFLLVDVEKILLTASRLSSNDFAKSITIQSLEASP